MSPQTPSGAPTPPGLNDLPVGTLTVPAPTATEQHSLEGGRNANGSVGTRNILAVTQTVQGKLRNGLVLFNPALVS